MDPRLVSISGSTAGSVFRLSAEETTIGRDPTNGIQVSEQWVSRHHCAIKREEDRFQLIDLESHNGTFVNGVPVKNRTLAHADRIEIPGCLFLFLVEEDEARPATTASPVPDTELGATLTLRRDEVVYLDSERLAATAPSGRLMSDLGSLLRASRILAAQQDVTSVARELLDVVFELVPAERGALVLLAGDEAIETVYGRHRSGEAEPPVEPSRSVLNRVLGSGTSLLSNDVREQMDLASSKSLKSRRVRAVVCIPLVVLDRVTGALYLEATDPDVRFDASQLELLTALGVLSGAGLANAQRADRSRERDEQRVAEARLEHQMVGESDSMRRAYALLAKVAPSEATVLIRGESGTGKELAARAIHLNSGRAQGPFLKVDCTTLTESLLESELFGHEKGAFTGAIAVKKGRLEMADGGTVFLDEVGELAPSLQAKLLRVLQDREFERVGATRPLRVDVRVVAATNRDLEAAVEAGTFRRDLYYRLNVVAITMPSLRERGDDVLLLASYFLTQYSRKVKRRVRGLSPDAAALVRSYRWPGNVRELENAIERAVVLGTTDQVEVEDFPEALLEAPDEQGAPAAARYHDVLRETKRRLIRETFVQVGGSYTETAQTLGLHPNYLHRLVRNLGLRDELKKLAKE